MMPPVLNVRSRSGSRDGVALLAVLAFVLLLTILIVSFISYTTLNKLSTVNYGNAVQAQEVAQDGLQDILYDLHQEIIAGSVTPDNATYTQSQGASTNTLYLPTASVTVVPARLGYLATKWTTAPKFLPSLVRVSRASQTATVTDTWPSMTATPFSTYYTNIYPTKPNGGVIINRASKVSTGTASVDGRYISPARWNKPYLLASSTSTLPTPFYNNETLPITSYLATPDLPDWVYVTRTGSRVCTTPTPAAELAALKSSNGMTQSYATVATGQNPTASPVVGRYAYVIYDEGSLLDANVAGSPSTLIQNYPSAVTVAATTPPSVPFFTNSSSATPPFPTPPIQGNLAFTGKSYLSFADLTQLPGLSTSSGATAVDTFVKYRNAGGLAKATTTPAYLEALFQYAQTGFTQFTSTTGSPSTSDSPFLSRQDLISYFTKIDSNINTGSASFSQALPYLGTFSRAVSAPSYSPPLNASQIVTPDAVSAYHATLVTKASPYHDNMEMAGSAYPNRDLPNVRFAETGASAPFVIAHYTDDGSVAAINVPKYYVSNGDPLMQNRFSLAKINWLAQADPDVGTAPSSNYATAIQSCFGLTWGTVGLGNGGNACWIYSGSQAGTGATAASFNGTIETLDQVAKEGREPNFFEILKAAILSGSLGQNPGPCVFGNGGLDNPFFDLHSHGPPDNTGVDGHYAYSFDVAGLKPAPCQVSDMQIIQIGANIIDQYDADSYPTAIYFHYQYPGTSSQLDSTYDANSGTGIYGAADMVYGIENLPELMGFYLPCCTVDGLPAAAMPPGNYGPSQGLSMWWQPEIWNPHAQPSTATAGSIPSTMTYMIKGFGQLNFEWSGSDNPDATKDQGTSLPQTLDNNQTISFTDGAPTTSAFFAKPLLLTQTGTIPNVTVSASDPNMLANSTMEGWSGTVSNGSPSSPYPVTPNHFVGFWSGNDANYAGTKRFVNVTSPATGTTESFAMGWIGSGGKFHPYSFAPGIFSYIYGVVNNTSGLGGGGFPAGFTDPLLISAAWHAVIDPRTQRFSAMANWTSGWPYPGGDTTLFPVIPTSMAGNDTHFGAAGYWVIPTSSSFVYDLTPAKGSPGSQKDGFNEEDWVVNSAIPLKQTANINPPDDLTYYVDPDGVARPGDGFYDNWGTGDGQMLFTSTATTAYPTTPVAYGDSGGNVQHGRRPIILNRPFRSVGELGYVFRDLPMKTLDFFTSASADAALLDVFSLTDESKVSTSNNQITSVVAGQVNISNASLPVLQALLSGGSKKDLDATYNLGTETSTPNVLTTMATNIANNLNPSAGPVNPLLNRAALVTQITTALQSLLSRGTFSTLKATPTYTSPADRSNKAYLEAPIRALANVTNTRTWNLLIDVIAQSGQIPAAATSINNFVVQGERRYWLHVAIDRYTGKIVSQQLEPVYE